MPRLYLAVPMLLGLSLAVPVPSAYAQVPVAVSVTIAPPPLPVYEQPPMPALGYIWSPGYWAWGPDGYYWVPGTWVLPPELGLLWTPGYWGWLNGVYLWHAGYWGPYVGFYGGIDYGFGYTGVGYEGGYWNHGAFYYNRAVNNFGGVHVTHVYNHTVVHTGTVNRVSYNGGAGGLTAHPSSREEAYGHQQHVAPTALQIQHQQAAAGVPQLRVNENHGRPPIAATARPSEFSGRGVVGPRPVSSPPPTHGETPHPVTAPRPATAPQPAQAPHPTGVSPTQAPHPTEAPRAPAPRPAEHLAPVVRPAEAPRTPAPQPTPERHPAPQAPAPRPAPAPHPAAAPHPQAPPPSHPTSEHKNEHQ